METPRISLVIPNRNGQPFAKACADSVRPFLSRFHQLIVVDGESSDGSGEVLFQLAKTHPNSRCINAPPKGIYNAWNLGVSMCDGDWILILPSDDELHPDFLDRVLPWLSRGLPVITGLNRIQCGQGSLPRIPGEELVDEFCSGKHACLRSGKVERGLMLLVNSTVISLTQALIPRRLFTLDVGLFDENSGSIADYLWFFKAAGATDFLYIHEKTAIWRIHEMQASQQHTGERVYSWKVDHAPYGILTSDLSRTAKMLDMIQRFTLSPVSLRLGFLAGLLGFALAHPLTVFRVAGLILMKKDPVLIRERLGRQYLSQLQGSSWITPLPSSGDGQSA